MPLVRLRVVMYAATQTRSIYDRSEVPLELSLATTPLELVAKLREHFPEEFRPRVVLLIVDGKRVHASRAVKEGFGYAQHSVMLRELAITDNVDAERFIQLG